MHLLGGLLQPNKGVQVVLCFRDVNPFNSDRYRLRRTHGCCISRQDWMKLDINKVLKFPMAFPLDDCKRAMTLIDPNRILRSDTLKLSKKKIPCFIQTFITCVACASVSFVFVIVNISPGRYQGSSHLCLLSHVYINIWYLKALLPIRTARSSRRFCTSWLSISFKCSGVIFMALHKGEQVCCDILVPQDSLSS